MRTLTRFFALSSLTTATFLLFANCSERGIQQPDGSLPGASQRLGSLVVFTLTNNGELLGGAAVSISGPDARTGTSGSDGTVAFLALEPGEYSVATSAAGFECGPAAASVFAGQAAEVEVTCRPLLEASWSGTADPIELTLTADRVLLDGSLSGSGVVGSVHAAFAFELDGQIDDSGVTLVLGIVGEQPITFRGTFTSDNRIVGVLNGAGFDQFGISLEPVTEAGGEEESQFNPSQPQPGVSEAFAGAYSGSWTIFVIATRTQPDSITIIEDTVEGSCTGSVTLEAQSLLDRLFGRTFSGSYLMLDTGDCTSEGITVSGSVKDGQLRGDGGVNFGLEIPGSDGNFFEDVLAGSGVKPDPDLFILLGCEVINKDVDNQMDGSILDERLSAIASAFLFCPGERGGSVNMSVAIDASK